MPRHIRREFAGAKYHVTNRGNGRQQIFVDPVDCVRFMEQLVEAQDYSAHQNGPTCAQVNGPTY